MPYLRSYHKLEKPEIAFSSKTGSKADIENQAMLVHEKSITDHFDIKFEYVNPQGRPESGLPFFGTKCSPAPPRDRRHFILLPFASLEVI